MYVVCYNHYSNAINEKCQHKFANFDKFITKKLQNVTKVLQNLPETYAPL